MPMDAFNPGGRVVDNQAPYRSSTKNDALHPLHDRVLVKKSKSAEKTPGGIIIPETSQDGQTVEGEVVAVGPGRWEAGTFVPTSVKVGHRVLYYKHAGTEVKHGGETLMVLMESELVARVGGEGVR